MCICATIMVDRTNLFYLKLYGKGDVVVNITIVGRKCTPRENFKERAEEKLRKVEKFFGPDATAKITATVEKNQKICEDK